MWDFGDGTSTSETTSATVTHVYSTPGTFTATLTVRDNRGATSTPATLQIHVGSPLTAPVNVAAPAVQGSARVGLVLTATTGAWTGSEPLAFSYEWVRCDSNGASCNAIAGAADATYTLVPDDFGDTIRVIVTATNLAGSAVATSDATARVKHACSGSPC
jgi:PKD repeat protein